MSDSLESVLNKSFEIGKKVSKSIEGITINDDTKDLMIAAYLSLNIQHHSAILKLIELKIPSSAAALFRSLTDAYYRMTWLSFLGTDIDVNEINTTDYNWLQTWKLADKIDQHLSQLHGETITDSHDILRNFSRACNGYTHGGIEQLARQFKDGTIEVNFEDDELIELVNGSNAFLSMTLLTFANHTNNSELRNLAEEIVNS
ncbi:DUF6988 family protein [Aliarcobacter butzleri]|uniref:DUF6988 family protein n=1 Tax=Aliarcobacter butzleri TaxID=28197 RepID=UPI003B215459